MLRQLVPATLLLWVAAAHAQCPPPTTPILPPDGTVTTQTLTAFTWQPAGSAVTGYDLYVSRNGAGAKVICFNSPSPNCTAMLTPGRYEWFVRNYRDDCPYGTESKHFCLRIDGCLIPAAPTELAPDGVKDVPVGGATLTWSGGAADTYDVFLERGTACTTTTKLNRTPLIATPLNPTSLASGPLEPSSTYAWRVSASGDPSCSKPVLSRCATFTTRACDQPEAFTLRKPEVVGTHVTLSWEQSHGANTYSVYVNGVRRVDSTRDTVSCMSFNPSSDFTWYVEATGYGSGNCRTRNKTGINDTFRTGKCVGPPTLLAPLGRFDQDARLRFRWQPADQGTFCEDVRYTVWVANEGGQAQKLISTAGTSTTLAYQFAGGYYNWYVVATEPGCPAVTSETGSFSVR